MSGDVLLIEQKHIELVNNIHRSPQTGQTEHAVRLLDGDHLSIPFKSKRNKPAS